jgi:hypothetical protein
MTTRPPAKVVEIPLPQDRSNVSKWADWLELRALVASDRNSSKGDMESVLRRAPPLAAGDQENYDRIDVLIGDVFKELENRQRLLGKFYPFTVHAPLVERRHQTKVEFSSYVFCLCLSYLRDDKRYKANECPRLTFERMSSLAGEQYLGGELFIFGTARKHDDIPRQGSIFMKNLAHLGEHMFERGTVRTKPSKSKKDDCVDVVIRKSFKDKRPFQLALFGQCATGKGWKAKIKDLQPKEFWDSWYAPTTASVLVKSFFIPHVLDDDDWEEVARHAGIVFDRYRVVGFAAGHTKWPTYAKEAQAWINNLLARKDLQCA